MYCHNFLKFEYFFFGFFGFFFSKLFKSGEKNAQRRISRATQAWAWALFGLVRSDFRYEIKPGLDRTSYPFR